MSDRRMVYPYTLMAKVRNTPFMWHYKNNLIMKCYFWSAIALFPFMWKIQKLTYSEGNLKALEEYKRREALEIEEHKLHQL